MKNLVIVALVIVALAIPAFCQETSPLSPATQADPIKRTEDLITQAQINLYAIQMMEARLQQYYTDLQKDKAVTKMSLQEAQETLAKLKAEPKPEDGKDAKKKK